MYERLIIIRIRLIHIESVAK